MKEIIARNLGLLRSKLNLTQAEMANYLGINSRELISYYEKGERDIPLGVLESCCNLFGIDLIDMFEENEDLVKANMHLAYRADNLTQDDIQAISKFKKIINNYQRINRILDSSDNG
jgi:transcriptional regulator with XRE-family HTH domain